MNKYKIRTFVCKGCNKEVILRRSKNKLNYCSQYCYNNFRKPRIKIGKIIKCEWCGKEKYKSKCHLKNSKNLFCSINCSNYFQGKNKLKFKCRICDKIFKWSKSRMKQANPTYCSMICRNKDKLRLCENSLKGNLAQINKNVLNRLEKKGTQILEKIGLKKNYDFFEQVPLFNKFIVDIFIPNKKLVIQWDGVYWHTKEKRKKLDESQDKYLKKCGYEILRITDKEIKKNEEDVYDNIKRTIR